MLLNDNQISILVTINQGITNEKVIANNLQIEQSLVRTNLQYLEKNNFIIGARGFRNGEQVYITCHLTNEGRVAIEHPRDLITEATAIDNRNVAIGNGNYNENITGNYYQGYVYKNCTINKISPEIPIGEVCKKILCELANFFKDDSNYATGDSEISQAGNINKHKVRVCLEELYNRGYIELHNADTFKNERYIVTGLTSRGWVSVDEGDV